jgi:hypothetical protein
MSPVPVLGGLYTSVSQYVFNYGFIMAIVEEVS